jgi:hypothetical protein
MADSFQPRFVDLVRNYSATQGTENFVLGSAIPGYRGFQAAIQPGESFYYSAIGIDKPAEFEVGRGTMEVDGTISRDPIGGTPTSFTTGNKSIALVAAAEWYEGVQSGSAGASVSAASRDAIAALTDTSRPVLLHEARRAGLFAFDPSDLSAKVAADPAQGIHIAPASDPTGASGAWVRKYAGSVEVGWFGTVADGIVDDTAAIQAAVNWMEAAGGGELRLGSGTFAVSGIVMMLGFDMTLDARGATLVSGDAGAKPAFYAGGDRTRIVGGTWKLTGAHDGTRAFDVEGRDCEFDGLRLVKEPEAGSYHAYVRHLADGFVMRNCRTEGSNGIFCEASRSAFLQNRFKGREAGGDDAIAIKGIQGFTRGVRIIGNEFENLAYFCSIGSEIGVLGADDPTYSRGVGDVVVAGNRGLACTGIALIKPGVTSIFDYRDGTVENVTISDNVLSDSDGAKFSRGIAITPARGARVRNVRGRGNIIRARAASQSGRLVGAVDFYIPSLGEGSAKASISDVDLQVLFDDPFDGASNDVSRPGFPVTGIVFAELADPALGEMSNIRLDVRGNGCTSSGVSIGSGLDDAFDFRNVVVTNTNRSAQSLGGFFADSRVRVGNAMIGSGSAFPYNLGSNGEIVSQVSNAFFFEQVIAGSDGTRRPWAAPRRCLVTKIELLSSLVINQSADDSNYTQFEIRNSSGTGNIFHTVSSKLTGGQAFPADTYNVLLLARSMTSDFSRGECFFAQDGVLGVTKNDFGSGRTVQNAYLRIHWTPY